MCLHLQVPQFILDQHFANDKVCNIVVTQPRKIAAISVAKRVCDERNWKLGQVVGYQVLQKLRQLNNNNLCAIYILLTRGLS